jgi:hypothetical protein
MRDNYFLLFPETEVANSFCYFLKLSKQSFCYFMDMNASLSKKVFLELLLGSKYGIAAVI